MKSDSEGKEGVVEKRTCINGGCVNFILQISSNCRQGRRMSKNLKILCMSLMDAP